MPTYDYKCDACGNHFERFQSITAAPIRKCPSCGKNKVRRLISAGAGLIFKGSGFYITDYRSEGYKNAAKSDSGATETKPQTTKGETKSDATPSPSTDSKPKTESKPATTKGEAKKK